MTTGSTERKRWAGMTRTVGLNVVGVVTIVVVLIVLPMVIGSLRPSFFSGYHDLTRSYDSLQASAHTGIACGECHVDPRGSLVGGLALAADFYANLPKKEKAPVFVKFSKPGKEACLACHRTDWSMDSTKTATVPHPAHLRVASETRECVTCHKWAAHEEVYQEKHKDMPFSGVCVAFGCHVGTKTTAECSTCHHSLRKGGPVWTVEHRTVVQKIGANACFESCHEAAQCRLCHTTGKRPVFTGLATKTGLEAIEVLHVKPTWIQQHGTEALKDPSKCLKCHVSEGECRDCHARRPAFHGSKKTWTGVHKKVAKDERRCLTCHKKPWCTECHDAFKEMR